MEKVSVNWYCAARNVERPTTSALDEGAHHGAFAVEHHAVERGAGVGDHAVYVPVGRCNVRQGQSLRSRRAQLAGDTPCGAPGRVGHVAPALEPVGIQFFRIAVDLFDVAGFIGPDDVELFPYLKAGGNAGVPAESIAKFGLPCAAADLQTLELPVDDEVGHPAKCVGAVGGGGTAGHHVHGAHQRGGQGVDVD